MTGECHGHIFMNGVNYKEAVRTHAKAPNEAVIRAHLEAYRQQGITYVRDGGDHYGACTLAKELAPAYGIRYRIPVFGIYKNGYYGKIIGYGFDTMQEYHQLVKKAIHAGADFIKIATTGIMDFAQEGRVTGGTLSEEEVRQMVQIAHEEGMAVMSHTNGAQACAAAIRAGVDSLEHGNFMDADTIELLADSQTVWVPTVVTVRNLLGDGRFADNVLRPIWEKAAENLRLAFAKNAYVAVGSDAGAYRVLHGKGALEEYQAILEAVGDTAEAVRWLLRGMERIQQLF